MDVDKKITSRVFLVRHGETEWSKGGKHTARTEVPLSEAGEKHVLEARDAFIGPGTLIDPASFHQKATKIKSMISNHKIYSYCSPRGRARRTCELLNIGVHGRLVWEEERAPDTPGKTNQHTKKGTPVEVTERLKDWDYGEYEGLTITEVHELRKKKGLDDRDRTWNIWIDGCPGGEYGNPFDKRVTLTLLKETLMGVIRSPQDVSDRLDSLISEILSQMDMFRPNVGGTTVPRPKNVVCVAHGHVLAAFALRWAQQPLRNGMRMLMETGGVAVLGYVIVILNVHTRLQLVLMREKQ
jgi:probable phosphoglycerate mutase